MIRSSLALVGATLVASSILPAQAEEADPNAIVALQFAVGGDHKGVRASGAKGVCLKGTFAPAPTAAALSKAPQFSKPVPVTARFSMAAATRRCRTRPSR